MTISASHSSRRPAPRSTRNEQSAKRNQPKGDTLGFTQAERDNRINAKPLNREALNRYQYEIKPKSLERLC
jgi:hypothetical protein